jgi:hypothetical protein
VEDRSPVAADHFVFAMMTAFGRCNSSNHSNVQCGESHARRQPMLSPPLLARLLRSLWRDELDERRLADVASTGSLGIHPTVRPHTAPPSSTFGRGFATCWSLVRTNHDSSGEWKRFLPFTPMLGRLSFDVTTISPPGRVCLPSCNSPRERRRGGTQRPG